MTKLQYKIDIPYCYAWGVLEKYKDKDLFVRYVKLYIKNCHQDMKIISIKRNKDTGDYFAICEKG